MLVKSLRAACLAVLFGVLLVGTAFAQAAWPSKPIKIIVPWPPGGAADLTCRLLQVPLAEILGQTVVIENKSGGGGIVGTEALVRSPADGHTIGMVISSHASNMALHSKLPYDTLNDTKPITIVTRSPNILVVHPSTPYRSLADIVEAAKSKPGSIHYATSGNGTAQHFGAEHIKLWARIDMVHVPYRGAGPALNDLVGGQVLVGILNIASTWPHVQSGRLRPIAVTGRDRSPNAPDVPAVSETITGFDFGEWFALMAPGRVPDEIVERLYAAIAKAAKTPEFQARALETGMEVVLNTPAAFRTMLDGEVKKFADLVREANIKIE
ncbi:MAG: tripartite tricarboxylate transporter substrate binding protein [Alphaproteobacteria bacterium]|nr:tripartite tricarboxylate transporter substrate binding protein [Alphaproteobacteria bacterium]